MSARCRDAARAFGYLLRAHADGWALFCRRERLNPDAYAGEYRVSPGMLATVTSEGGRLFSRATGHPKAALVPVSDTEFIVTGADVRFTFDKPRESRRLHA